MRPADAELLARVAAVPREELLDLVRDLERARDAALLRLLAAPASRLLTPQEAAEVARVPVRRVRSWARAKRPWARWVGRLLRVDEPTFRAWMLARCSEPAPNARETSVSRASDVVETVRTGRSPRLRRVGG